MLRIGTRALLIAAVCTLEACGTSSAPSAAPSTPSVGNAVAAVTTVPTSSTSPAPTVIPAATTSVSYDSSIGTGVDPNGFAYLPLRPGAKRFFVNSAIGNDSRTSAEAQNPSTPLATEAAALALVADGEGDQILMAEGTSYAAGLSNMSGKGGYSFAYPAVIESYDPNDALNEGKYGRAGDGRRPVLNTGATLQQYFLMGTGNSPKYIAVRGVDFNPGNVSGASIMSLPNATGTPDGILWENDIFRYTTIGLDNHIAAGGLKAQEFIVRNCAFYGEWNSVAAIHSQGIYLANVDGYTIEDSVFWHVGWKVGASRSDDPSIGGATYFRHPIYAQVDTLNGVVRRNLFIDNATEGGSLRGGIIYTQNLGIKNAVAVGLGGGTSYDAMAPNGVKITAAYNAFIASAAVPNGADSWGIATANGTQSSSVHHNVIVNSSDLAGPAFLTQATYNQPSYMNWHDNVVYRWSSSGNTISLASQYPTEIHSSFDNNVWDDPSSGTNQNNANTGFPTAYSEASLLSALGYQDEATFVNTAINNPEKHIQRQGVLLMLTGYGIDTSAMIP